MIEKIRDIIKSLIFRIHILKVFCVLILMVLVVRLYIMQVTYSPQYESYLEKTQTASVKINVPRGLIYDRYMEVLVDNEAVNTVTYQYSSSVSMEEMYEIATDLADLIEVEPKLAPRDLKDLFLYTRQETDEVKNLVSKEEKLAMNNDSFKIYQEQLNRISEEEHISQLTDKEKEIHTIYVNMNRGSELTTNIIKNGATEKEIAVVSERLMSLPGVNVGVDWNRTTPSIMGQSSIFGRVSTYEQGLPVDLSKEYLAKGYAANDRVGLSQLEFYYEELLRGYKKNQLITSEAGETSFEEIYEGQSGFHLGLTIDAQLQAKVNDIIESKMRATKREAQSRYLREAYVVMLDPYTGEVLSMNGKIMDYDDEKGTYEFVDAAWGTFQRAYTVGSVVKGATLLAGYDEGITNIGDVRYDKPLIFADGSKKGSWKPLGMVNDSDALKFSSNIYFMLQTIRLGGGTYVERGTISLDSGVFDIYRSFFAQFGLGTNTGIDLPSEFTGIIDRTETPGKLLDFAIGQADTYTTMQLAQYMATIITNGKRFAPHIVRDVYVPAAEEEEKQLLYSFEPQLQNIVDLDQAYFERVKHGFRRALQEQGGTGYGVFNGVNYNPAGKTGTAEGFAFTDDGQSMLRDASGSPIAVHNTTLIAYAPYDDPQVAIAVVLPQAELPGHSNLTAQEIGRDALQAYFDLQKERDKK